MTAMAHEKKLRENREQEVIDRTAPPGEIVYEAIYAEGEHELQRNNSELALSGLAAGLSMGFSMMGEALLRAHLPDERWTPLLTNFGYSVGFLIVILGRQQLFTKNTLTVILPLLRKKKAKILGNVARLWVIVLLTNLVGAFVFAWVAGKTNIFSTEVRQAFASIGERAIAPDFWTLVFRGAIAGWLIALMVWLLPFAESARVWVIIILAYLVGLAQLPHVIAGNVETFYLVTTNALPFWTCVGSYLFPVLIGNIIGGVALVAVGAHAEFFEAEKQPRMG